MGCATPPKDFSKSDRGSWRAKTLVQDKKLNRSYIVYIDILATKTNKLRMDVETSLGIHLASLAYDSKELDIVLPQQKKFYSGSGRRATLSKMIPIDVRPELIISFLFDEEAKDAGWKCNRGPKGALSDCFNVNGMKITWKKRMREQRVIAIESKRASIQMQLRGFNDSPEIKNEMFTIGRPSGYKRSKL
ncbi:MAG: hypothetical protein AB8E15_05580 [Bdellovibrionales bacterium]